MSIGVTARKKNSFGRKVFQPSLWKIERQLYIFCLEFSGLVIRAAFYVSEHRFWRKIIPLKNYIFFIVFGHWAKLFCPLSKCFVVLARLTKLPSPCLWEHFEEKCYFEEYISSVDFSIHERYLFHILAKKDWPGCQNCILLSIEKNLRRNVFFFGNKIFKGFRTVSEKTSVFFEFFW